MRLAPIGEPLGAALCGGVMAALALFTLSLPGSLVYPLAYAQVLIALIAVLFFASAAVSWREASAAAALGPVQAPGGHAPSGGGGLVMVATILLCVLYAASWTVIGYFPATFFYVALQLKLLGERRWWLILALSCGAVLLVYVVFHRLLQLPFPGGMLFDNTVTSGNNCRREAGHGSQHHAVASDLRRRVGGIDLREPVDAATLRALTLASDQYAVLVFRGQNISDAQQIDFSARFGALETTIKAYRPGHKPRLDLHISDVSNVDENSNVLALDDRRRMNGLGNRLWHTDSSFKAIPARYSLLSARAIPPSGGETQFADMRAAYDALPAATQARIDELIAEHSRAAFALARSASPTSRMRNARSCRRCRSAWCARIPDPGARRCIWPRTPAGSAACRSPRRGCCCAT